MTAVWICLALCVGTLFGYCLRAGMERANADSRELDATECEPFSFSVPLTPDEKKQLVVDLNERGLRKAGR